MRSLWALALLAVTYADDAAEAGADGAPEVSDDPDDRTDEETETYGIMKEVSITMVSQVIDGTSFVIKDKDNKPVSIHIGTLLAGSGSADKLSGLLQRSMILYRPFPDDMQPGDGTVHADVWTAEGAHIGMHLAKAGTATGNDKTTDYTRDILQVAAEQEKAKSYKALEEALKEQGAFEKAAHDEMKAETDFVEAKAKDPMLIMCALFVVAMIVVPVVIFRGQGSVTQQKAKQAAARAKAAAKATKGE